jgi:hypothetical protein
VKTRARMICLLSVTPEAAAKRPSKDDGNR